MWLAEVTKVRSLGGWDIKKNERSKHWENYHLYRLDINQNYMCFSQIV